jgi:hypothetical protein
MAHQLLDLIYNIPNNYYSGYKNATYLKEKFVPCFTGINNKNLILTKEELRKLESHLCTGKSRSLLSDSLYNSIDVLNIITEKQLLTEKFVIRIIDVIKIFLNKNPYLTKNNFTWIINLKKNGFKFNEEILKLLSSIGFKNDINLDNNIDNTELEFIHILSSKKADPTLSIHVSSFLEKNPQFTPKYGQLKTLLESLQSYTLDNINNLFSIYQAFIKNNYQIMRNDIILFLSLINKYYDTMYASYSTIGFYPNEVLNKTKEFIELCQSKEIKLDQDIINNFIKTGYRFDRQNFTEKYLWFLKTFHEIMLIFMEQNETKVKFNYLDYLTYTYNSHNVTTNIIFDEFKTIYTNLIKYLYEKKILDINDDTIRKIIFNKDNVSINYIITNNIYEPSEEMMNYACFAQNINLIKTLINYKFIPNIKNVHYLRISPVVKESLNILNTLITLGGLPVNEELIEYLISKNCIIHDLEKYGLDTDEMKEKIKNMCIKHNKYPYEKLIKCEFQEKIKTISHNLSVDDLNFTDNLNMYEKTGILKHLIHIGNINLVIFMIKKYPELKAQINVSDICYNMNNFDIYVDIFNDLKIK